MLVLRSKEIQKNVPVQKKIMRFISFDLEIELSCYVEKTFVPLVTANRFQLSDILVLHLVNGKDFFVPLSAEYKPSVFGMSLDTLVRIYGPVNDVSLENLVKLETDVPVSAAGGGKKNSTYSKKIREVV